MILTKFCQIPTYHVDNKNSIYFVLYICDRKIMKGMATYAAWK